MKVNSGKTIKPPTLHTAKAFGVNEEPSMLPGGFGTSYRAGDIVLKPKEWEGEEILNWISDIFHALPETKNVRFGRPVKSQNGNWVEDGYVARQFLAGEHVEGMYEEKLKASREMHDLLNYVRKPEFLNTQRHSWAASHMVALGEKEFDYEKEFADLYEQIKPHLGSIELPKQVVHGDLGGNFLYEKGEPLAIIDFSPAWAPNGFAEGIMLADVVAWENPTKEELEVFKTVPNIGQMAWRGTLARIAEQAEHMKWFEKDRDLAITAAQKYQKAIDYLKENF